LSPGGSGYFTCIQNVKLVTNKFKPRGLHEKHVVATWRETKKNLCRGGRWQVVRRMLCCTAQHTTHNHNLAHFKQRTTHTQKHDMLSQHQVNRKK